MLKRKCCARHPSNTASWRRENKALMRDFPQKWQLKRWKRSFRARLPSKIETCLCHNEALGAQTIACATLGLCDPRGTLSPFHHLRPHRTSFQQPQERFRGTDDEEAKGLRGSDPTALPQVLMGRAWEVKDQVGPARRRRLAAFPPFPSPGRGRLPSGKRLHNYGKSPCLVGNQLYKWQFSIVNCKLPEGTTSSPSTPHHRRFLDSLLGPNDLAVSQGKHGQKTSTVFWGGESTENRHKTSVPLPSKMEFSSKIVSQTNPMIEQWPDLEIFVIRPNFLGFITNQDN